MSTLTKIIGWFVLAMTEIMICVAFFTNPELRGTLVTSQVGIFATYWTAIGVKNFIDLKRDQIPESAKEL